MSCSVAHALVLLAVRHEDDVVATPRAAQRLAQRRRGDGAATVALVTIDRATRGRRPPAARRRARVKPRRCGSGSCARASATSSVLTPCARPCGVGPRSSVRTKRTTASRSDVDRRDRRPRDRAASRCAYSSNSRCARIRRPGASGGAGCCARAATASPGRRADRHRAVRSSGARGLLARRTAPPPVASTMSGEPRQLVDHRFLAIAKSASPSISKIVGIVTPSRALELVSASTNALVRDGARAGGRASTCRRP